MQLFGEPAEPRRQQQQFIDLVRRDLRPSCARPVVKTSSTSASTRRLTVRGPSARQPRRAQSPTNQVDAIRAFVARYRDRRTNVSTANRSRANRSRSASRRRSLSRSDAARSNSSRVAGERPSRREVARSDHHPSPSRNARARNTPLVVLPHRATADAWTETLLDLETNAAGCAWESVNSSGCRRSALPDHSAAQSRTPSASFKLRARPRSRARARERTVVDRRIVVARTANHDQLRGAAPRRA